MLDIYTYTYEINYMPMGEITFPEHKQSFLLSSVPSY